MEEKKNKKGKVALWVIIGIILVAIVAVIVIPVVMNYKNSEKYDNHVGLYSNSLDITAKKPIIYIYPEEQTEITVKLGKPELVTCSYPKYKDEWKVIANPDGSLVDIETGKNLYSLYWEGKGTANTNDKEGFCVKGEDTAKFLEEKLSILGLNEREAEEFIIYWLPKMEENKYNYIRFATMEEINEYMPLEFSKEPDTLIRVLMQYKGLNKEIEIKEQKLQAPERKGFTIVEWGGTELK